MVIGILSVDSSGPLVNWFKAALRLSCRDLRIGSKFLS